MALLGNILWFVLGGWALFLIYAISAVIFFPAFIPLFRLALYSAWPFGRSVVSKRELHAYRNHLSLDRQAFIEVNAIEKLSGILNVLWMFTFGWIIALSHLVCSLANVAFIWMIITIPNIVGHWKLMPVAFMPFNKAIVPIEVEREIKAAAAKAKLRI